MKKHLSRLLAASVAVALFALATGCAPTNRPESGARNVILMVGDGMGMPQITALMIARGEAPLALERATVAGAVKTFSASSRVTDSAAGATAYATGEKTTNGHLSVDTGGKVLETILEKAEKRGFATGLVATTLVEHATPGAFYAHTTDRDRYEDIALDLLPSNIDVAIGAGLGYLTRRADGRNLVEELRAKGYTMTESLSELEGLAKGPAMALYDGDNLPYIVDGRDPDYLTASTRKALDLLTSAGEEGFFLLVEGSLIDYAGHDNNAEAMLGEMRDFDAAVGVAFDYADSHPGTLVLVLGDHETGGLTLLEREDAVVPGNGVQAHWSTGVHSATMVPVFAYGTGAEHFGGIMDNTEVNRSMEKLLRL